MYRYPIHHISHPVSGILVFVQRNLYPNHYLLALSSTVDLLLFNRERAQSVRIAIAQNIQRKIQKNPPKMAQMNPPTIVACNQPHRRTPYGCELSLLVGAPAW